MQEKTMLIEQNIYFQMRKLIIIFTILIITLTIFSSVVGVSNYRSLNFEGFVTESGEQVEILSEGIYKYNVKSWVLSGMPWDIVRLVFGIPLLIMTFIFYLKGSLKATMLFIGILFSFVYQSLLWAIGWHFNALFLVYTLTFTLCLVTLLLVVFSFEKSKIESAINKNFPVRTVVIFLFIIAGMLLLKCLGEIMPMQSGGELKESFSGYYNLFDQFIDLGIIVPFVLINGILLLKRNVYGFLFSTTGLILLLNIGLSVVSGQAILGVMTSTLSDQIPGISIFSVFMLFDGFILVKILSNIHEMPSVKNTR
jgi:hypothetical protein